jgi:hypothetical protein
MPSGIPSGISLYHLKLTFADEDNSVTIALSERTGLGAEVFNGRQTHRF